EPYKLEDYVGGGSEAIKPYNISILHARELKRSIPNGCDLNIMNPCFAKIYIFKDILTKWIFKC
ncbi:MAG: hypothetical protein QXL85_01560, partial [Candidatus Bathyarchaeia archaeon]